MVLDTIYGMSWAWSSVILVTLIQSWRKLLPDLEDDDFQGFPNKETSKSENLDIVCAMKSYENTNKDNVKEWL
jgi:hypothetical protein